MTNYRVIFPILKDLLSRICVGIEETTSIPMNKNIDIIEKRFIELEDVEEKYLELMLDNTAQSEIGRLNSEITRLKEKLKNAEY